MVRERSLFTFLECAGRAQRRRRFGLFRTIKSCRTIQSAVAAALCRRTPKSGHYTRLLTLSQQSCIVTGVDSFKVSPSRFLSDSLRLNFQAVAEKIESESDYG